MFDVSGVIRCICHVQGTPIQITTERADSHEQGTPHIDDERIGTIELNLKNSYTVFNTGDGCGTRAFVPRLFNVE